MQYIDYNLEQTPTALAAGRLLSIERIDKDDSKEIEPKTKTIPIVVVITIIMLPLLFCVLTLLSKRKLYFRINRFSHDEDIELEEANLQ